MKTDIRLIARMIGQLHAEKSITKLNEDDLMNTFKVIRYPFSTGK